MFQKCTGMIWKDRKMRTSSFLLPPSGIKSGSPNLFLIGLTALSWRPAATCGIDSMAMSPHLTNLLYLKNRPFGIITGAIYSTLSRDSGDVGFLDSATPLLVGRYLRWAFRSERTKESRQASSSSDERNTDHRFNYWSLDESSINRRLTKPLSTTTGKRRPKEFRQYCHQTVPPSYTPARSSHSYTLVRSPHSCRPRRSSPSKERHPEKLGPMKLITTLLRIIWKERNN